jgi:hypothetical protein
MMLLSRGDAMRTGIDSGYQRYYSSSPTGVNFLERWGPMIGTQ